MTFATRPSVGSLPSKSLAGAGACTTTSSQARQAYFGRRITTTRTWAGTTSRRSETSSPMRCKALAQHGQAVLSTSTRVSTRGRWEGRAPQFARRLAVPGRALGGRGLLGLGVPRGLDLLGLLQPEQELVFGQALGPAPEAVALHRLDDLAQPLVLGPLLRHERLQGGGVVGEGRSRGGHERIRSCLPATYHRPGGFRSCFLLSSPRPAR